MELIEAIGFKLVNNGLQLLPTFQKEKGQSKDSRFFRTMLFRKDSSKGKRETLKYEGECYGIDVFSTMILLSCKYKKRWWSSWVLADSIFTYKNIHRELIHLKIVIGRSNSTGIYRNSYSWLLMSEIKSKSTLAATALSMKEYCSECRNRFTEDNKPLSLGCFCKELLCRRCVTKIV